MRLEAEGGGRISISANDGANKMVLMGREEWERGEGWIFHTRTGNSTRRGSLEQFSE